MLHLCFCLLCRCHVECSPPVRVTFFSEESALTENDLPNAVPKIVESPEVPGTNANRILLARARYIVESLEREPGRNTTQNEDGELVGDIWWDDIVSTLVEGGPIIFHLPSGVPILQGELTALVRCLDAAGHSTRIVELPTAGEADVVSLVTELTVAGGRVTGDARQEQAFHPTSWLIQAVGDLPESWQATVRSDGIRIRDSGGRPTPAAAAAAAFSRSAGSVGMHVHLLLNGTPELRYSIYTLLRATDSIRRDCYHIIGLQSASGGAGPEPAADAVLAGLVADGLVAAAQRHLRGEVRRRVDFSALDSARYLHDQYGREVDRITPSGILSEDESLISWLALTLPRFFYADSLTRLAVPGWGPFSYLGLLLAPLLAADAVVDLSDPADSNVDFANRWRTGGLDSEDAAVARKFERFIVAVGGARYENCEERLRRHARVRRGELSGLEHGTYDLVADSFVACSISSSRQVFFNSIQTKRQALKDRPDAGLVSLHMVGSQVWQQYPNVCLSASDIVQAYADAGLDTRSFVVERTLEGDHGWEGMVAVIAKPVMWRSADRSLLGSAEAVGS